MSGLVELAIHVLMKRRRPAGIGGRVCVSVAGDCMSLLTLEVLV